ncbi:MAG: right-handed parallel beta-helix repeat-containing protein, partial [Mangrovicoccus sp.]|nr:right-handed parallel beta-helix repeat-containing protein [Mangrovicoccus sp.]
MVTQEIYVESAAALSQALSLAQGGEVFVLAPGDYGALHISGQDFGPAGITIQSADPDDPAVFSRLSVYHSSDIAFAHVSFDYIAQPDAAISTPVTQITGSENISFAHSSFLGDPAISRDPGDHGYGAGFGLRVRDSRGILVEESDFSGLLKGIHIADSQDILLQSNEISQFRSDGINLVNVQNAQVLDNYIHSPARSFLSDDHPDMIQMWSSAETPEEMSRDVTIKGNLLDIGSGDYAQGLYISNRSLGRDGEAFIYKNFLIEENVIIGDHSNGLRVGPVDGLVITGNTLLHMRNETAPNPFNKPPQILLEGPSQNVTLTDNLAG